MSDTGKRPAESGSISDKMKRLLQAHDRKKADDSAPAFINPLQPDQA